MSEEKKRYLWTLCAACRKRLQGLGYLITDSERASGEERGGDRQGKPCLVGVAGGGSA
jgi:hypothetical protein